MSCSIDPDKITVGEVRDLVRRKEFSEFKPNKDDAASDVIKKIQALQNKVTTELVDNTQLVKGYHLDPSGKTMRYVWLDTKELAFSGRVTDINKAKFVKRKGVIAAEELSSLPDNVIKRDAGTKVHKALEKLAFWFIKNDKSGLVANDLSKIPDVDEDQIKNELGVSDNVFLNLKEAFSEIWSTVKSTQKQIDPNGKFWINPETFMLDFTTFDKGGTADLLIVYSDKSGGLFDYKTMSPLTDENYKIKDPNWIADYKIDEFNTQISTLIDMYRKIGITKFRHARIVPIQISLAPKAKTDTTNTEGARLTDKFVTVKMGEQFDEYLTQIPIIVEETGNESLDRAIKEAITLKNNLNKRLKKYKEDSAEYNKLVFRIKKLNKSINEIMLNKDINFMFNQYRELVNRYMKGNSLMAETRDPNNSLFLNNQKIKDLLDDLSIFEAIASSTPDFIDSLELGDFTPESYLSALNEILGKTTFLKNSLAQRLIDLNLTTDEYQAAKNDKSLSWFDKLFRRFSNINNTIFQKVKQLLDLANTRTRLDIRNFESQLKKIDQAVQAYGNSVGLSGMKVYELFVNKKTGNLHTKYLSKFYDELSEARKTRDDAFLNKYLKLREDAQEIFEKRKLDYMFKNSLVESDLDTNDAYIKWESENDPSKPSSNTKYSNYWFTYYEINEDAIPNEYFNPDFVKIKSNQALLDYYNFWTNSMETFREYLDLSGDKIPRNFIPWIKANTVEQFMNNGINISLDSFKNIMSIQENNELVFREGYIELKSEIDPDTGLPKREIPRYFINPLINQQGEIDSSLKSFDLSSSLMIFAGMAYNYNNLKEHENTIEALKEVLARLGVVQTTAEGKTLPNSEIGKRSAEFKLLEDLINSQLYGAYYKEKPSKATQGLQKLRSYQQLTTLALDPISSTVNLMGARTNALFQGVKGYFYTRSMYNKALDNRFRDTERYKALAHFFQPYANKRVDEIAKEFKGNKIAKKFSYDNLFVGFRLGDEHIDEQVLNSMLQNYTIVDGKLKRLTEKDRNAGTYKSLLDSSSVDSEGNLIIEGLLDANGKVDEQVYTQFRNTVLNTIATIKGGLNSEDMNAINLSMSGKMLMTFRNWLPDLADERFRGITDVWSSSRSSLRINPVTNTVIEGRYTAFFSDMNTEDKALLNLVGTVAYSIGKLSLDVITFGGFFNTVSPLRYKVNEDRAKMAFEKFLELNKDLPAVANGTYTFEDFLEYKQGQIKALSIELQFMVSVILLLMALGGGFDDDDEKFAKKNLATRTLYRVLNRYRRELVGIINPNDWNSMFRDPLPIMSLGNKTLKTINNTFDTGMDVTFGEAEGRSVIKWFGKKGKKKDMTPAFYYTWTWMPGYKLFKWLDIFEKDKQRQ